MPQGISRHDQFARVREQLRSLEGANLLVNGPPLVGKGLFAVRQLNDVDEALLVTTTRSAPRQLSETQLDAESIAVVDCTPGETSGPNIQNVSSPADLTGISMPVSSLLADADRPVVAVDSLSALLMYVDEAPLFRFLSVMTGHVRQVDGLGLYTLDEACHDEQTVNTLQQLFDGRIELREADDGTEFRVLGVPDVEDDWRPL